MRSSCVFRANSSAALGTFGPFQVSMVAPHVAQVLIQSPKKVNVMDDDYFRALHHVFANVLDGNEAGARAVVLAAAPTHHFCAGLDLKSSMDIIMGAATTGSKAKLAVSAALGQGTDGMLIEGRGMPAMRNQKLCALIRRYQDAISAVARCRLPVIAAIHKQCIGGAVDLITACDFRYAAADAVFSVREGKVAIVADIGTLQRLPAIVGEGVARELTFTARDFGADEAQRIGLVNRVFADHDALMAGTLEAAAQVAANSPLAVQGMKAVMNHATERTAQDGLDHVRLWNAAFMKSDDLVAAGVGFMQKRPAQFTEHVIGTATTFPRPFPAASTTSSGEDATKK